MNLYSECERLWANDRDRVIRIFEGKNTFETGSGVFFINNRLIGNGIIDKDLKLDEIKKLFRTHYRKHIISQL